MRPPSDNSPESETPSSGNAKRKVAYGPPALTRKDFILAWSLDIAAFRTRQKQSLLDRRAAKRAAKLIEFEGGNAARTAINVEEPSATEKQVQLTNEQAPPAAAPTTKSKPTAEIEQEVESIPSSDEKSFAAVQYKNPEPVISVTTQPANSDTGPSSQHDIHTSAALNVAPARRSPRRSVGSDGLSLQHVSIGVHLLAQDGMLMRTQCRLEFLSRTQILAEYRKAVRATKSK